jgi:flagellar hook protein FlgE
MFSSIGLSGLKAAAQALDLEGNNIANANTTGYKQQRIGFADMVTASGGANGAIVRSGVVALPEAQNFAQGSISTTTNSLDCAINGSGFFRMVDPYTGTVSYTRNGSFHLDANRNIVNDNGQKITGFNAINNVLTSGQPEPLSITATSVKATLTSSVNANINLDATSLAPTTAPFDPNNADTYNFSSTVSTFDEQGIEHSLSLYFVKDAAANTWTAFSTVKLTNSMTAPTVSQNLGAITFKANGTLNTPAAGLTAVKIDTLGDTATIDISEMTQVASNSYTNTLTQNGKTAGLLTGYNIHSDGKIFGTYTNGQSDIVLGQVALANFNSPSGLQQIGNSSWKETAESGNATVGTAGSGPYGSLQSYALETSNVDITSELINLMASQRIYQANAQTIKAQDTIAQTTVNL